MPPSPSMSSSQRELIVGSSSTGPLVKAKDDDLALFKDMQLRERDEFLLCSSDDFEDSLSKLKYFPDFKLNIPVQGERSDLLNAECEKNDYEWLLTPPETPLFPSLDDDEPRVASPVPLSSSQAQPTSITKSSTTESRGRRSRSSVSPRGRSPSSRSATGLPVSGRHSSPPSKPASPTPRSSTPTLKRMSSISSGGGSVPSSTRKGASPVKASRGSSASPKLRGWQPNAPGFCSESSSSLRASLPDRPASRARGLSPTQKNRGDLTLRNARHSMSPTASTSVSSSHSHDQDSFSNHSKGSIGSSGDDNEDFLRSVNGGATCNLMLRKNGRFSNGGSMVQSNKLSRAVSASSAPKSSFDSALRQMGHHKTSEDILKTILSSVPARTFYVGKPGNMHHPMFSMNASTNASSDGSSEFDGGATPEAEGGEHGEHDIAGRTEKMLDIDGQEDIFTFDKMDGVAAVEDELYTEKLQHIHGDFGASIERTVGAEELERLMSGVAAVSDVCSIPLEPIVSVCIENSQKLEAADEHVDVCQLCEEKDPPTPFMAHVVGLSEKTPPVSNVQPHHPNLAAVVDESCEKSHPEISIPEATEDIDGQISICKSPSSLEKDHGILREISSTALTANEREQIFPFEEFGCGPEKFSAYSRTGGRLQRFHSFSSYQSRRIDGPEGAGTPVFALKRSNSDRGPAAQDRPLIADSKLRGESSSSTCDLSSPRQEEGFLTRQFSCSKDETKGAGVDLSSRPSSQNTLMSLSAAQEGPLIADSTLCAEPSSSTVDLSSPRQGEGFLEGQFSCSKDETKGVSVDLGSSPQSTLMSLSAAQEGPLIADSTLCAEPSSSTVELSSPRREEGFLEGQFSCSKDETKGVSVDLGSSPQNTLMSLSAAQEGPLIADSTLCAEPSSSTVDLSSPRQGEGFLEGQFSCSKDETKGVSVDLGSSPQSTLMSLSAAQEGPLIADSTLCAEPSSSAVDLSSPRREEGFLEGQFSCSKDETKGVSVDLSSSSQSTQTSLSGASRNSQEVLDPVHMNSSEADVGDSVELSALNPHGTVPDESHRILVSPPLELVNETENTVGEHMPASDALNDERRPSSVNAEDASQDQLPTALDSCLKEVDETVNTSPQSVGAPSEAPLQSSSGALPGRVDDDENFMCLPTEREVSQSLSCTTESSRSHSALEETDDIARPDRMQGESGVMVEAPVGNRTRCLTLEEAADSILFCSSIVQDLAFQAAAIGMEKERPPPQEDYRPSAVSPEKPASDEKSPRRSATKSTKARRKISEMDAKIVAAEPGSNGKIHKFSPSKAEPPDKVGHGKPLKLDSSKMCSCTVM